MADKGLIPFVSHHSVVSDIRLLETYGEVNAIMF